MKKKRLTLVPRKNFVSSLWLACLCTGMMTLTSCNDDDTSADVDDDDVETYIPSTDITVDEVKTLFKGKVALIGGDGTLLDYFQKRLPNTTPTVTDDTQVVLMNEQTAGTYLNDATLYATLQNHWLSNRTIGVFKPSVQTLKLFQKLNGIEGSDNALTTKEAAEMYSDIVFYMANAQGKSMAYQRPDKQMVYTVEENNESRAAGSEPTTEITLTPTDYHWGKVAERAAEWMNKYSQDTADTRAAAFTRSTGNGYEYSTTNHTVYKQITVDHNTFINDKGFGTGPGTTTTETIIEYTAAAGYKESGNYDIYDVQVNEIFDGGDTYVKNMVTKKKAAYKYKYSGGCYRGIKVNLEITNVNKDNVSLHEPVPIGSPGSYTTIHNPGSVTVGGSLSGAFSGGISGLEPNVSGSIGVSMSGSYTLPSTSVSYVHDEMPIDYTDRRYEAEWDYYGTKPQIYRGRLGFNAVYQGPPEIMIKDCQTDQAVTFKVSNSRSLGNTYPKIYSTFNHLIYQEACSHADHYSRSQYYKQAWTFTLPIVYRYFDKYTPYCYQSSDMGDSASWANLETRLKGNVNYKCFCDESLRVGATLEAGVASSAQNLWMTTLYSLVNQYNGTQTTHEYVIALAGTNGRPLPMGLHIKDGVWSIVNDITTITIEKK